MRTVGLSRMFNGKRFDRYKQVVGYEKVKHLKQQLQERGYEVRVTTRRYVTFQDGKLENIYVVWIRFKEEKK